MNGAQHYREAEKLVEAARADYRETEESPAKKLVAERVLIALDAAQVHATLALAAATAESIAHSYNGGHDGRIASAWTRAIS